MITFIELGRLGRLGNQLFQYAALRGLGLEKGYEVKIPNIQSTAWHGQECLLNNFNIEATSSNDKDLLKIKNQYTEPDPYRFDDRFFNLPDDINLSGFFQSIHYFSNHQEQIKKELTPKQELLDKAKNNIDTYRNLYPGYEIVSLHLRRGDNADGSNPSKALNELYGANYHFDKNSVYGRYLTAAKDVFKDRKVKYLVFTGGSREEKNNNLIDIEWCKNSLIGDEYIHQIRKTDAMEDFCNIMSCDHNILGHVSSFGWWAAYLNKSKEKIVVAPNKYSPDDTELSHRAGFYPKEYVLK